MSSPLHRDDACLPADVVERDAVAPRGAVGAERHIVDVVEIELAALPMRQQCHQILALAEVLAEIDEHRLPAHRGAAAAIIVAVGHDGQNAGPGPDPVGRRHLDREAIFVAGPVDPDLVADHEHGQKPEQTGPLADETQAPPTCSSSSLCTLRAAASNQRVDAVLIGRAFVERVRHPEPPKRT
ncbi:MULTISPECIES: hypothetical protein [Bradyrhizobium]|uniref:hypothetical protein n=1 Tax=Bradyrhizobium TaxID=374 RepID=UPI001E62213F|nr:MULTISPECIES: hypothetical protein [Bradyrhizobium]UFW45795.1 hypothetical protein BaraCB756_26120 [Bradyrhizobium arachidis]